MDASCNGQASKKYKLGSYTPIPAWQPRIQNEDALLGKCTLEPGQVQRLMQDNDMDLETLMQALVVPAAKLALPYLSNFYVGAVGLGGSGRIYFGANLEFLGGNLGCSVHAEQCLTANLLRHNERELKAIAISAAPCGHCRQFFSEFCSADRMKIMFGQGPNNVYRLADILPFRFGPSDLIDKDIPLLLQEQHHDVHFTQGALEEISERGERFSQIAYTGLEACRRSYTPYTRCPASVHLISSTGSHCSNIVESAAHSPTFQPLQAAFSIAMLDGLKDFSEVSEAVLIELEDAALQQEQLVRALLRVAAPLCKLTVLNVTLKSPSV